MRWIAVSEKSSIDLGCILQRLMRCVPFDVLDTWNQQPACCIPRQNMTSLFEIIHPVRITSSMYGNFLPPNSEFNNTIYRHSRGVPDYTERLTLGMDDMTQETTEEIHDVDVDNESGNGERTVEGGR